MNGPQGPRDFDLSRDISDLERKVAEIDNVKLIAIDPLSAHLGRADTNSMTAVRTLLAPLADLAARKSAAVLLIAHLNKRASSTAAIARVAGSGAFVAAVRAAYLIVKDPDDPNRRLLLPLKNNVGRDDTGLAFRVESVDVGSGLQAPRIRFEDELVTETADEILRQAKTGNARAREREQAKQFLLDLLADGPVPSTTVYADGDEAGLAARTLRRAADDLGIERNKMGLKDGWEWALPDTKVAKSQGRDHVATFEGGGHLRPLRPDANGSGP
jgi:putative DNA primase/helicase